MKPSSLPLVRLFALLAAILIVATASAAAQSADMSAWDLAFGQVPVGSTLSKTDTLTNSDTPTLTINSITAKGTGWSQTNDCPATLARAAKCTITVTFAPTATGSSNGTVTVASNDPTGNQVVDMTGTGAAAVAVSPTSLTFAAQVLNTPSAPKTATLTKQRSRRAQRQRRDDHRRLHPDEQLRKFPGQPLELHH